MDLKEVGLIGSSQKSHWYYTSKARALQKSLGGWQPHAILDVGAGTGYFARMLLQETSAASAVCVDPGYADERSEVDAGKPIAFRRSGKVGQSDLVLLMDVLEHIDDDVSFLRELVTSAEARTTFVISVPAFSWLWSPHDEFLGHRRRYTAGRLARLIKAAGLTPVRTFYMFAAVFPAVVVQRILGRWRSSARAPKSDLREHHRWTNWVLKQICLAECAIATRNRAFGLTVFGVARKI
jgi:Methyltransferase domain